jgi:hypothetical protein
MTNFEKLTELTLAKVQAQIDDLKMQVEKYPELKEFVELIIAYGAEGAYCGGSDEAQLGRCLIQFIWEINGMDLSNMGNSVHFDSGWTRELDNFIGNYIHDDSAFDFVQKSNGTFTFKSSGDEGRWLQDPRILVEAAKANRAYYTAMDNLRRFDADGNVLQYTRPMVDNTKVMALLK